MHKEKVAKYLLQKDRTVSCFLLNFHGENIIIGTIQSFTCNVCVYSPSQEGRVLIRTVEGARLFCLKLPIYFWR